MTKKTNVILLFGLIVFLSIVDIFMNLFSLIPVIGDIFESLSEVVIEAIQVGLVMLMAVLAGRK
jgi:hypothetical protein